MVWAPIVLVVDDNVATRKLIRVALARDGYTVLDDVNTPADYERLVRELNRDIY